MQFYLKQGWVTNPNTKVVDAIVKRILLNNGDCPCNNDSEDKHCPCTDYIENDICHCGLYVKINK